MTLGGKSSLLILRCCLEGDAEEMFSRKEVIDQVLEAATFVEVVAALNAPVK